jgi:YHS domain-containing protein
MFTRILNIVTSKYVQYRDARFLKKHRCTTWKEYHRYNDPDVDRIASRIKYFYRGYPYVYCFEDYKHDIYYWDLGFSGYHNVTNWCEHNCKDKFRFDGHRAICCPATTNEWEINEIGGGDYYFAAFKNEQDYAMFLLRWA